MNTTSFPSLKTFRDLYKKPTQEQVALLEIIETFTNDCDVYIANYLCTNKKTVTLMHFFIYAYYRENSAPPEFNTPDPTTIKKHASMVVMSLAETGVLDDNMLTMKNMIVNVITPPLNLDQPSIIEIEEEVVSLPEVDMDEADASNAAQITQQINASQNSLNTLIHNPHNNSTTPIDDQQKSINRADLHNTIYQKCILTDNQKNKQPCFVRIRYDYVPGNDRFTRINHVTTYFEYKLGYEDMITFQYPTTNMTT